MAFSSYTALHECALCKRKEKFFKLFRSERKEHTSTDDEGRRYYQRLCVTCETGRRVEEINGWSQERINEAPTYATEESVSRDIKRQAKGERWYRTGQEMKKAKIELKEEIQLEKIAEINSLCVDNRFNELASLASSVSSLTKAEKRTWVMHKSQSLATALVAAIFKCDMMVDVVGEPGDRMKLTAEALEKMDHAEASWDRATLPEAKATLEEEWSKAATIVADQATYQTAAECGRDQGVFLKALDFADEVGPDIRMYNVCTQPCSIYGKCGLAFPSKLWW